MRSRLRLKSFLVTLVYGIVRWVFPVLLTPFFCGQKGDLGQCPHTDEIADPSRTVHYLVQEFGDR